MGQLDDALAALLERGGPAAALVRGLLVGVRVALDEVALDEPDRARADHAAKAIERLLAAPPTGGVAARPIGQPTGLDDLETGLAPLRSQAVLAADERSPGTVARDPGQLWEELHLLGLRMSPEDRLSLQERAAEGVRAAGGDVGAAAVTVLGPGRETLIPQLRVGGRILCEGLETDPDVPPPAELRVGPAYPAGAGPDAVTAAFIRLVAPVLYLIARDRYLSHCLQVLQFRGLAALVSPTEQERLRGQLIARTSVLIDPVPAAMDWLERMVRAHEALSSVVHVPPAPETSWWGRLRAQGHTLVRDAAAVVGPGLVKLPQARFASARSLTDHNIPLKVPESSGMVLACVRVWSRIHDTEKPGRVIYGS